MERGRQKDRTIDKETQRGIERNADRETERGRDIQS